MKIFIKDDIYIYIERVGEMRKLIIIAVFIN